ncbi:MAG: nucleotide exchange factor GrpE [Chloroflexi bacterium]|nr:nucleotide exchange factor GrpE [Chloroflexota bacterium]OJV88231.1 MAG: nucleotide exchange factor GrpE [Chloroflexi bacterium 54-19]
MSQVGQNNSGGSDYPAPPAQGTQTELYLAQLTEARREAEEYKNRYLRAAAEIENVRKQAERDAAVRSRQDRRRLLLGFLEVADSLERALAQVGEASALQQGVRLALNQMLQALGRAGVERIPVKSGDQFDPVYHEAIEVRAGDVANDTVLEVVRPGYLHEKLVLRPAQVVVAQGKP